MVVRWRERVAEVRSDARRALGVLMVVALLVGVGPLAADMASGQAAGRAIASAGGTVGASVSSWRAAPAPSGLAHMGGPLTLTWATPGGDALATFDIANVGDLTLVDQRIVLVLDGGSGGSAPDPIVLTACVGGVWDASGTSCPGTLLPLGSDREAPLSTGVTLAPGERLNVRATTRRRTAAQTRTAVEIVVGRTDVRAATTTSG